MDSDPEDNYYLAFAVLDCLVFYGQWVESRKRREIR